jgi:hypothetical protein
MRYGIDFTVQQLKGFNNPGKQPAKHQGSQKGKPESADRSTPSTKLQKNG